MSEALARTSRARAPVPLRHWRSLVLGVVAVAAAARTTELLLRPRFFAEEASVFFRHAFENGFVAGLLFVAKGTAGYLLLACNVLTTLGTLVPLEWAPFVTTYGAFALFLVPLWIVLWGRSLLWSTVWQKLTACALLAFAPVAVPGIWLTTISVQVYCGAASFLILCEDFSALSWGRKRVYYAILLLNGLTGVYTAFLSVGFGLRWLLRDRNRDWTIATGIVVATSALQLGIFVLLREVGAIHASKLGTGPLGWQGTLVGIALFNLLWPVLGEHASSACVLLGICDPAFSEAEAAASLDAYGLRALAAMVGVWTLLLWLVPRSLKVPLVASHACVVLLTAFGAVGALPSGRYMYVSGVMLLLLLLGGARWRTNPARSAALVALLAVSLGVGVPSFYDATPWVPFRLGAAAWDEEVSRWRRDPDRALAVRPYPGWTFHLADPALMEEANASLAGAGSIPLRAGTPGEAHLVPVGGLPSRFRIAGRVRDAPADGSLQLGLERAGGDPVWVQIDGLQEGGGAFLLTENAWRRAGYERFSETTALAARWRGSTPAKVAVTLAITPDSEALW